jgi:paired amphipathic helix protein Sin3a
VEAKNYFKALDYQGITFKANDKRRITTKHLITEIEERRSQQQEEQHQTHEADAMLVPRRQPSQFTFDFKQQSVIKDVMRLVYYFFERTELYSNENQDKMRAFMETLLPLVFGLETVLPDDPTAAMELDETNGGGESTTAMEDDEDTAMADGDDEAGDEADDEEEEECPSGQYVDSDDDKPASQPTRGKKTNARRTLLKDILTENIRQTGDATTAQSESETDAGLKHEQQEEDMDVDIPEANDAVPPTDNAAPEITSEPKSTPEQPKTTINERHVYNLFGDSEFYCFFRLYQVRSNPPPLKQGCIG